MAKPVDVLTMPIHDLKKRAAEVQEHIDAIEELLTGLVGLTPDGRQHTSGKYRSGEAEALVSVLDVADQKPALFESLASLDDGLDPKAFETDLLRDRLTRASLLGEIQTAVASLGDGLSDTVLHLGDLSRPVMLSAYDIVKSHAKTDGTVAKLAKGALDYYAKIGRASAAAKRAKKKPPAGA